MKLDRLLLCVERQQLLDGSSCPLETVFFFLYVVYYIFPSNTQANIKIIFFIDSVLMGLPQSSASGIVLQNFIKCFQKLLQAGSQM